MFPIHRSPSEYPSSASAPCNYTEAAERYHTPFAISTVAQPLHAARQPPLEQVTFIAHNAPLVSYCARKVWKRQYPF